MSEQPPKRGKRREPIGLLEPKFVEMTPEQRDRAVQAMANLLAASRRDGPQQRDPDQREQP